MLQFQPKISILVTLVDSIFLCGSQVYFTNKQNNKLFTKHILSEEKECLSNNMVRRVLLIQNASKHHKSSLSHTQSYVA